MASLGSANSLSRLMQASTYALQECHENLSKTKEAGSSRITSRIGVHQTHLLLNLMETLVVTKNQLSRQMTSNRVVFIDPKVVNAMRAAITIAMADPIDAKINQLYLSLFGYNSLWQVLKEVQKLLQTIEFLKAPRGKKVAKVDKKHRERRKKQHEKDENTSLSESESS